MYHVRPTQPRFCADTRPRSSSYVMTTRGDVAPHMRAMLLMASTPTRPLPFKSMAIQRSVRHGTPAIAQWDVLNNTMDADGMERMPCEPLRILCASHRGGPNVPDQMWRHSRGTRVTKRAEKECDAETPLLEPLLGAGFVFSRGERVVEVRNECCTPFLFDGEEFSLGARLWTHGYDLYAPMRSIAYHPYGRKNIPLVWDLRFELRDYEKLRKQGTERIHAVLHDKETSYKNYDTTDLDKFTLGTKRSLHQFGEIFRVNWKLGRIDVCEVSGKLHKRIYDKVPDDKTDGIDYSGVRAKDLWGIRDRDVACAFGLSTSAYIS
eukprot:GEMP01055620.1.p1 GENE.GEMP01055620.1~~GEMP01055620.1.p1  ORF type:complete len:321 (+),score=52.27 GEMP01055620.1:507-1469(+)